MYASGTVNTNEPMTADPQYARVQTLVNRLSNGEAPDVSVMLQLKELAAEIGRYAEHLDRECIRTEHLLLALNRERETAYVFVKSVGSITSHAEDREQADVPMQKSSGRY